MPYWRDTVAAVDRALFVPDVFTHLGRTVDSSADADDWRHIVYLDLPIVTQVNDGRPTEQGAFELPTSSSSMPSIMLEMLALLAVEESQRVLEIGTGTGYHAAWLSHRLGSANVTSVEVDPGVHRQAGAALAKAGYSPHLVLGDGLAGHPDNAPYDRIISTCTIRDIPAAWLQQMDTGKIVTPWGSSFFSHSFVALDVDDRVGLGRFSGYPAFMWARQQRAGSGYLADHLRHRHEGAPGTTRVDPRAVASDPDALFFIGLRVTDAWSLQCEAGDGSDEATLWLLADDRKSWASADYVPGRDCYAVEQYGPRSLWDEVEAAHRRWRELGRPARDRFGLTVTPRGQYVWLDGPANRIVCSSADGSRETA